MAPSRIQKALGTVKDQTSISIAKVASSAASSELDVAIVKATRHGENPAEEKYIREILSLTCYSRMHISSCVNSIAKRLTKTRSWAVALKCLVLIHRLLNEGDPAYEQEVFFATRRGTRLLNLSDFRDTSRSDSWDFSAFVRTFALYLDEHLEFRMQGRRFRRDRSFCDGDELDPAAVPSSRCTPVRDMKTESIFSRTQHLQLLLERFLACRPTGAAKNNRIVAVAMYPMVKESYQIYFDLTEIVGILIDRFMELEVRDCVRIHEIFCRLSKQFIELDVCYKWCKKVGIARSSEYPEVEKITSKKLDVMEEFIRDKSDLASRKQKQAHEAAAVEAKPPEVEEIQDMNSIKALPAPESAAEIVVEPFEDLAGEEETTEKDKKEVEEPADFLNLREDTIKLEDHGNQLALSLFEAGAAAPPKWEAFTAEETAAADWETALVQSASNLSTQKTTLAGGFDQLLLDTMYQHPPQPANGLAFTGSASSLAIPQGQQRLLALPAPVAAAAGDPFAASLAVEPPAYVRISDMEKKQQLLVEEQVMWQQYAKDGMQGQLGLARLQQNPHPMNGYQQRF